MKKEKVLITGASGSLARRLILSLSHDQFDIVCLTTNPTKVNNTSIFYWNVENNQVDEKALANCHHVVHLAGHGIMNPWTPKNRQLMYSSRVQAANLLFEQFKAMNTSPKTFITASAVGYYGHSNDRLCEESNEPGTGWLSEMCVDWESAAQQFETIGTRVVQLRISLLLSKHAGFLQPTSLSMKLGLATVFGVGNRPFEWMHLDDVARFIQFAITNNHIIGPYNMASPHKLNQIQFMKELKRRIAKYALLVKLPSWFLGIIFGQRSILLEGGSAMSSQKLLDSGFLLNYPTLASVIKKEFNR